MREAIRTTSRPPTTGTLPDAPPPCYPSAALTAPMQGNARALAYFALFTEIGFVLFVTTLGGALGGHWLDQQLGTSPIFVVLGFLLGAGLGAVADYRLVSRFLKRLDSEG